MFRIFNRTETRSKIPDEPSFTRFEERTGRPNPDVAKPKFTRFGVPEAPLASRASAPARKGRLANDHAMRQAATAPSKPRTPVVNHAAHLHAEDHIPLWVIRNALPQRFAAMNKDADTFDFL